MIPIRDENPTRRVPFVNYALIVINVCGRKPRCDEHSPCTTEESPSCDPACLLYDSMHQTHSLLD